MQIRTVIDGKEVRGYWNGKFYRSDREGFARRGVYLYSEVRPDRELSELLPVVEITEKEIKLHKENLRLEP